MKHTSVCIWVAAALLPAVASADVCGTLTTVGSPTGGCGQATKAANTGKAGMKAPISAPAQLGSIVPDVHNVALDAPLNVAAPPVDAPAAAPLTSSSSPQTVVFLTTGAETVVVPPEFVDSALANGYITADGRVTALGARVGYSTINAQIPSQTQVAVPATSGGQAPALVPQPAQPVAVAVPPQRAVSPDSTAVPTPLPYAYFMTRNGVTTRMTPQQLTRLRGTGHINIDGSLNPVAVQAGFSAVAQTVPQQVVPAVVTPNQAVTTPPPMLAQQQVPALVPGQQPALVIPNQAVTTPPPMLAQQQVPALVPGQQPALVTPGQAVTTPPPLLAQQQVPALVPGQQPTLVTPGQAVTTPPPLLAQQQVPALVPGQQPTLVTPGQAVTTPPPLLAQQQVPALVPGQQPTLVTPGQAVTTPPPLLAQQQVPALVPGQQPALVTPGQAVTTTPPLLAQQQVPALVPAMPLPSTQIIGINVLSHPFAGLSKPITSGRIAEVANYNFEFVEPGLQQRRVKVYRTNDAAEQLYRDTIPLDKGGFQVIVIGTRNPDYIH